MPNQNRAELTVFKDDKLIDIDDDEHHPDILSSAESKYNLITPLYLSPRQNLDRFSRPLSSQPYDGKDSSRCIYTFANLEEAPLPLDAMRPVPAPTIVTRNVRTIPLKCFSVFESFFIPCGSKNSLRLIYFRQPQVIGVTFPWNDFKARISTPARYCRIHRLGDILTIWLQLRRTRYYCANQGKFDDYVENDDLKQFMIDAYTENEQMERKNREDGIVNDLNTDTNPAFKHAMIRINCMTTGISGQAEDRSSAAKLAHQFAELCVEQSNLPPPPPLIAPVQRISSYHDPELTLPYDTDDDPTLNLPYDDFTLPPAKFVVPAMTIEQEMSLRARKIQVPRHNSNPYKSSHLRIRSRSRSPSPNGPIRVSELPPGVREREQLRHRREHRREERPEERRPDGKTDSYRPGRDGPIHRHNPKEGRDDSADDAEDLEMRLAGRRPMMSSMRDWRR